MAKSVTLYLTRHGETTYNERGLIQGGTDTELTARGEKQAQHLAHELQELEVDALYSSPLKRSRRTAELIGEVIGMTPSDIEGIGEQRLGDWEQEPLHDLNRHMEEEGIDWVDLVPPGGESWPTFADRVLTAIIPILKNHLGETIIVVGHSKVNKVLLSKAKYGDLSHESSLDQGNACVNRIEYTEGDEWLVHTLNQTDHLSVSTT